MSKRRVITERKTAKPIDKKEVITVASGWNSMTNWLIVLIFVLPFLFSRVTLDPVLTVRYIFLSVFIILFLIKFFVLRKTIVSFSYPPLIKAAFFAGLLYCLWSIISTLNAINIAEANYETARQVLNIILLFIVMITVERENSGVLKLCKAIALVALIQSFIGIMQHYEMGFSNLPGTDPKPYGLMANRNVFGSAQVFLLPLVVFVLYKASTWWKYLAILSIAGITASVLLSQTRSAWLAYIIILLVVLILVSLFSIPRKKKWLTGIAVSVPVICVLTALIIMSDKEGSFKESMKQRAGTFTEVPVKISTTVEDGANERLKMWHLTTSLIKDHPVVGVGPGNWKLGIPIYDTTGLIWPDGKFLPTRPHNVYLQAASETGIPGAVLYFSMWILLVIIAFKILKHGQEDQRILSILLIAALGAFATDCMFSFATERIEHSLYIYLMGGIILGNYAVYNTKQEKKYPPYYKSIFVVTVLIVAYNIFIGYKKYNFEKHMNYAKSYESEKNYQEELSEVEAGKSLFVTVNFIGIPIEVRSGIAYKELKDYKNALIELHKAKRYNPNSSMIYNNMGTIYTELKDFNKAIENYKKALKLSPKMDIALKNLAINYFNSGNYAESIDVIGKVEKGQDSVYLNSILNEATRRLALPSK